MAKLKKGAAARRKRFKQGGGAFAQARRRKALKRTCKVKRR